MLVLLLLEVLYTVERTINTSAKVVASSKIFDEGFLRPSPGRLGSFSEGTFLKTYFIHAIDRAVKLRFKHRLLCSFIELMFN